MSSNSIAVIFVHYHTPELLKQAVKSVQVELAGMAHELIVVDNGSTDAERETIRHLPVRYLPPGHNTGYAAGINQGVAQTDAAESIFTQSRCACPAGLLSTPADCVGCGVRCCIPLQYWNTSSTFVLPIPEQRSRLRFCAGATCRKIKLVGRASTPPLATQPAPPLVSRNATRNSAVERCLFGAEAE